MTRSFIMRGSPPLRVVVFHCYATIVIHFRCLINIETPNNHILSIHLLNEQNHKRLPSISWDTYAIDILWMHFLPKKHSLSYFCRWHILLAKKDNIENTSWRFADPYRARNRLRVNGKEIVIQLPSTQTYFRDRAFRALSFLVPHWSAYKRRHF